MLGQVAVAHAVTTDADLQSILREASTARKEEPFAVQLPSSGCWIVVRAPGDFTMQRERPSGLPALEPADFYDASPERQVTLERAMRRTGAGEVAAARVDPLFGQGAIVRRDAEGWPAWSMLIEHTAYLGASKMLQAVDAERGRIGASLRVGRMPDANEWRVYWDHIHAIANLTLFTLSAPTLPPWLAGMPHAFEWVQWSPSFPYVRERTTWLAGVGARAAMAFGEAVVDRYVGLLRVATHPMFALDRVFGLCAIGLAHPVTAGAIRRELRLVRDAPPALSGEHASHLTIALAHAERLLAGSERDQTVTLVEWLGWRASARDLATDKAMLGDPGAYCAPDEVLALAALPTMIAASLPDFYRVHPAKPIPSVRIARTLASRWRDDSDELRPGVTVH